MKYGNFHFQILIPSHTLLNLGNNAVSQHQNVCTNDNPVFFCLMITLFRSRPMLSNCPCQYTNQWIECFLLNKVFKNVMIIYIYVFLLLIDVLA